MLFRKILYQITFLKKITADIFCSSPFKVFWHFSEKDTHISSHSKSTSNLLNLHLCPYCIRLTWQIQCKLFYFFLHFIIIIIIYYKQATHTRNWKKREFRHPATKPNIHSLYMGCQQSKIKISITRSKKLTVNKHD